MAQVEQTARAICAAVMAGDDRRVAALIATLGQSSVGFPLGRSDSRAAQGDYDDEARMVELRAEYPGGRL